MYHGPPGFSVHGILQARILEWVAISFSSDKVWSEWSEVAQSYLTSCDSMDCLPGSSIHGIFQARVLEWGAIAFWKIREPCKCKARWSGLKRSQLLKLNEFISFPNCSGSTFYHLWATVSTSGNYFLNLLAKVDERKSAVANSGPSGINQKGWLPLTMAQTWTYFKNIIAGSYKIQVQIFPTTNFISASPFWNAHQKILKGLLKNWI